jgi:hypothetical protein
MTGMRLEIYTAIPLACSSRVEVQMTGHPLLDTLPSPHLRRANEGDGDGPEWVFAYMGPWVPAMGLNC